MRGTMGVVIALFAAIALKACSAPSLHGLSEADSLTQDPGLVGEWATQGPTVTRVVVQEGDGGRYSGILTIHHDSELKTRLGLEVSLTRIGEDSYVDLYLAKPDRERLADKYGFLALPVHQFMMVRRDGDTLTVWSFDAQWLRRAGAENDFSAEVMPIAGREIAVITADTARLRDFLATHARDPGAMSAPMVFNRVGAHAGVPAGSQGERD